MLAWVEDASRVRKGHALVKKSHAGQNRACGGLPPRVPLPARGKSPLHDAPGRGSGRHPVPDLSRRFRESGPRRVPPSVGLSAVPALSSAILLL